MLQTYDHNGRSKTVKNNGSVNNKKKMSTLNNIMNIARIY